MRNVDREIVHEHSDSLLRGCWGPKHTHTNTSSWDQCAPLNDDSDSQKMCLEQFGQRGKKRAHREMQQLHDIGTFFRRTCGN